MLVGLWKARKLLTRVGSACARGIFERSVPVVAASVQAKLQTSSAPNAESMAARIFGTPPDTHRLLPQRSTQH